MNEEERAATNARPASWRLTRPASWRRWQKALFSVVFIALAVAAALAVLIHARGPLFFVACDLDSLRPVELGENSFLYSADDQPFATVPATVNRQPVELAKIDRKLQEATIAIEDRRFYEHHGVDLWGVVRALRADVSEGAPVEGGSTITQQLVRNLYLGRERTLARKLQEGCLAEKLERERSKADILASYLNNIYYGAQAYGVEAAAETYFSTSAAELTVAQAALLAGLPQAPSSYDPLAAPARARARRDEVLAAMRRAGYIDEATLQEARAQDLGLKPSRTYDRFQEPYFVNYVLDQLIARYGARTVQSGGLRIYTTLDLAAERAATRAIRRTLDRPHDPAGALVAIEPASGAIRVMTAAVPGRRQFAFNLAVQGKRQAGSAFKPFVLTEAVRRGVDPDKTLYLSAPFRGPPDNPYLVQTYAHTYAGRIPLTEATVQSDNTVYLRLTLDVGPKRVAELAAKMGIRSSLRAVDTIGLGVNSVSPLEMASAYATLAARGLYTRPTSVRRVVFPGGRVDADWGKRQQSRVLPDGVAHAVTEVLAENIERGTGTGAQIGRPAAGKTGTTDDYGDAWFAGYTPDLAAVVWVGYPQARLPMRSVHGIAVAGGTFPATIWADFMSRALAGLPTQDFPAPQNPVDFKRWCGPFQFALDYADKRDIEAGECPKPKPKPKPTTTAPSPTTTTAPTTTTPTTTTAPSSEPATADLVGKRGRVVAEVDNDAEAGQVLIAGRYYDARAEDDEVIPVDTRVEVVRVADGLAYVRPL